MPSCNSLLKEAASCCPCGKCWGCGSQGKATMACSFRFTKSTFRSEVAQALQERDGSKITSKIRSEKLHLQNIQALLQAHPEKGDKPPKQVALERKESFPFIIIEVVDCIQVIIKEDQQNASPKGTTPDL